MVKVMRRIDAAVTYLRTLTSTKNARNEAKRPNGVKRLCMGCSRLYAPGDVSHNLKGMSCVCVGCAAKEADMNPGIDPDGEDYSPRYSGVL